ncbi:hypothetical protein BGZ99_007786 [Dissophora globulifera]|uniref:Casein kinase substrate phosphoprotein PP28 domain-containing protein n=1 Tax=Dissophora globulifera TaxID=979702 RepID=A0A9P6UQA0_9FUNG|nr:hypothetical protein BGZ99_007786 [Dissophora globulifera]
MAGGKFKKPQRGGGRSFSRRIEAVHSRPSMDREQQQQQQQQQQPTIEGDSSDSGSEVEGDDVQEAEASTPAKGTTTPIPGIEVNNPNRRMPSTGRHKGSQPVDMSEPIEMSRKEREAAEKEAAKQRYWKLHQEGKTDEAKADMARLAIIRRQREEAAVQRLAGAKAKEEAAAAKLGIRGPFWTIDSED